MSRTLRRKHDRNHLYIISKGLCAICGKKLMNDWQVDHIIPYSICKNTEMNNLQPVCKLCNLKKGDKMLRKHQHDLIELTKKIIQHHRLTGQLPAKPPEVADIIAEVFPGGGKSTHAILVFDALKKAGIVDKLLWVVPRLNLKKQGAQEFLKPYLKALYPHNLEIRETEFANDVDPTRNTDGYITTYQSLVSARGNNPNRDNCHQYEFRQHRYLLFLDECQHIAKDRNDVRGYSYYKAVEPLFQAAVFKMGSSGTLFRHEKEKCAFVEYRSVDGVDGEQLLEPVVDVSYNYQNGIDEKAIIPIYFNVGKTTSVKYTKGGKEYNKAKLENNLDLSVALESGYGDQLLREGLQLWEDYRYKINPRSKLVIIGFDQAHCKRIQAILFKRGLTCALAISDEGKAAQDSIQRFKNNAKCNILVTCQMAYEGLDCKPATHLIVLTKIRSLPWLIQMFTRVMRFDPDNQELSWEKQQAFATIPDDPLMKEALAYIKAKPNCQIEEKDELDDLLEDLESIVDSEWEPSIVENKSSTMGGIYQSNIDGEELSVDLRVKIQMYQQKYTLNQPEIETYRMLRDMGCLAVLDQFSSSNEVVLDAQPALTIREKEARKRKDIETLARRLDSKFGVDFGTWNKKAHNAFRYKGRKDMTYDELVDVMNWMKNEAIVAIEEAKKKTEADED